MLNTIPTNFKRKKRDKKGLIRGELLVKGGEEGEEEEKLCLNRNKEKNNRNQAQNLKVLHLK